MAEVPAPLIVNFGESNTLQGTTATIGNTAGRDFIQNITTIIQTASAAASQGLVALGELMHTPAVNTAVVAFRNDFATTSDQIAIMSNYKDVHDLLHVLQIQCYNCIAREASRFPADETTHESLSDYQITLQNLVQDLHAARERNTQLANEMNPWMPTLDSANSELRLALEHNDAQRLQKTVWLLNRVLQVQPFKINTRLNTAAQQLRLYHLIGSLQTIALQLSQLDLDAANVHTFTAGITAFEHIHQTLALLVESHDVWQTIDHELRLIESTLKHDTSELVLMWPEILDQVQRLSSNATEQWVRDLETDGQRLTHALNLNDVAKVRHCFNRYRRQASERFYRVDVDLKRLCDRLRTIGEPLDSVLRMMA